MTVKTLIRWLFVFLLAALAVSVLPMPVFSFQEPWIPINNAAGVPSNYRSFGVAFNDSTTFLIGGKDAANNRLRDVYSYNTSGNSYSVETPLPVALESPEAAYYNNHIYIFGGTADDGTVAGTVNSTVYRYNIITKVWANLGTAPVSPSKAGIAVQGTKAYFYGGENFEGVLLFDLSTEEWRVLKNTGPRGLSALWYSSGFCTPDGKVHFYGGRDPNTNTNFNDVVTYDPVADSYTMTAIPANGHVKEGARTISAGTKIYFLGGRYFNGTDYSALSEVVAYNTQQSVWSAEATLPFASADHGVSVASMSTHSIYLFYQTNVFRLLSFDINPLSQWSEVSTTPDYPQNRNYYGSGYDYVNNSLYIVGGHDWGKGHAVKTVYQYNPNTMQYTKYPDLPVGLEEPNVAVIGRNLFVFGGVKAHYTSPNLTVYKYYLGNGAAGAWVNAGEAPRDLYRAGMAVKGREVYFYGGSSNVGVGSSNDGLLSYNVDTGIWTEYPDLHDPRGLTWVSRTTGFVTPDGKIHFYGGQLSSGIYSNEVVTYNPVTSTLELGIIPAYGTLKSAAQVVKAGSRFCFFGGWDGRPGCG